MADEEVDLIYIDPPFNTGKAQVRKRMRTERTEDGQGDRIGFGGNAYQTEILSVGDYQDSFKDFESFIRPRLEQAHRVLKPDGSLYFHIDYREAHYCKVMLDGIFGRDNFLNEIIWAYDFGGRAKDRWPAKHDNIFLYAKNAGQHWFNLEDIDRIPYMAPGLVGPEKVVKGKLSIDIWWHTIVGTNSKEKTGYPTQKPIGILERIVTASSNKENLVLDFFAGSGTTGQACVNLGRRFVLCDSNAQAIETMKTRFADYPDIDWITL